MQRVYIQILSLERINTNESVHHQRMNARFEIMCITGRPRRIDGGEWVVLRLSYIAFIVFVVVSVHSGIIIIILEVFPDDVVSRSSDMESSLCNYLETGKEEQHGSIAHRKSAHHH